MENNLNHIFSFYYSPELHDNMFSIAMDEYIYFRIANVLRMNKNDRYICFDINFIYEVVIEEINKKKITNRVINKNKNLKKVDTKIALLPCLAREYMNQAMYILGQQGFEEIRLIKTDLVQCKQYSEKDYDRFHKLIIQGCEEGKQYILPIIQRNIVSLEKILQEKLQLYWFYEKGLELKDFFLNYDKKNKNAFLCGPERGFSDNEITLLKNLKTAHSIKLGSSVLRSIDVINFASVLLSGM